jgi:adenylate cyclase
MAALFRGRPLPQNIEIERRLAAVLAADVAGFSRLTEADEVGTMRMLAAQRAILDGAISRHRGRIANTAGDSVLAEFPSAVNAVQCAVEAQQALRDAVEGVEPDRRVLFRIGIHVGDVMVRGGDLLGNGVNVAARLEALADAGGIVLSAAAHEQVKKILPLAYTDLGPQSVKNIEEPVRAFAIGSTTTASAVNEHGKALPLPDKPSIAVLPFQNMSGDPEQEYFADGMVEDIITALSRFKSLFVIARNSSFTYKGKVVDIKQVGRELGVQYVLEGSVRKAGGRVRITGQLIDAQANAHLWADKFDGSLDEVFSLQDDVASSVVGAIAPRLLEASLERPARKPVGSWSAYDHYLQGLACFRTFTTSSFAEALEFFRTAIDLDPDFGIAHAQAALCIHQLVERQHHSMSDVDIAQAIQWAESALRLAGGDAEVLTLCAAVLGFQKRDFEHAATIADRAIALNPNLAGGWNIRGWISTHLGEHERALGELARALRLNPVDPVMVPNIFQGCAFASVMLHRHEDAIAWTRRMLTHHPHNINGLAMLAYCSARLGQIEAAAATLTLIRRLYPDLRGSSVRRLWRDRMRLAADRATIDAAIDDLGLPE